MSSSKNPNLLLMLAIAVFFVVVVFEIAYGDDPHHRDDAELIGGDQSVSVKGSKSLALVQSLGDVDLGRAADCVVTEQYGIIIWQRQNWKYDPWCIAKILDEQGKHYEAAQMRCSNKPTAKLYGNNCIATLTFSAPARTSAPISEPAVIVVEENDDDAEREAEYHQALTERMDKMDANRAANVRRYNRDQAAQKKADEDFYGAYIEKFEIIQQTEKSDICCTIEEQPDNE